VRVGGQSLTAGWVYRFVQVYADSGAGWVEDFRDDSEWALTIRAEDQERLPSLDPGQQTTVQLGRWGEAPAYYLGSRTEADSGAIVLSFDSRPALESG
jgi:hypothetical protein